MAVLFQQSYLLQFRMHVLWPACAILTIHLSPISNNSNHVWQKPASSYTEANHHDNMSVQWTPPYTPLLYSKTGVYRGELVFLIFALKHRLWVLVRTASVLRFFRIPTIYVLSKNKKNITFFHLKITIFTAVKHWRCVRNVILVFQET